MLLEVSHRHGLHASIVARDLAAETLGASSLEARVPHRDQHLDSTDGDTSGHRTSFRPPSSPARPSTACSQSSVLHSTHREPGVHITPLLQRARYQPKCNAWPQLLITLRTAASQRPAALRPPHNVRGLSAVFVTASGQFLLGHRHRRPTEPRSLGRLLGERPRCELGTSGREPAADWEALYAATRRGGFGWLGVPAPDGEHQGLWADGCAVNADRDVEVWAGCVAGAWGAGLAAAAAEELAGDYSVALTGEHLGEVAVDVRRAVVATKDDGSAAVPVVGPRRNDRGRSDGVDGGACWNRYVDGGVVVVRLQRILDRTEGVCWDREGVVASHRASGRSRVLVGPGEDVVNVGVVSDWL